MFPQIAPARPPAIDDRTLATLTQIARDARHGNCSPAEAEWLLSSAGALLEELQRHRTLHGALIAPDTNVVLLPGMR